MAQSRKVGSYERGSSLPLALNIPIMSIERLTRKAKFYWSRVPTPTAKMLVLDGS